MCTLRIVIVNYRTPQLTIDCLQSLVEEVHGRDNWRVEVVENASPDDSAHRIGQAIAAEGWDGWVELKSLETNAGFAGGNNAAIRPILAKSEPPDYILLLNPDTQLVPGAMVEREVAEQPRIPTRSRICWNLGSSRSGSMNGRVRRVVRGSPTVAALSSQVKASSI